MPRPQHRPLNLLNSSRRPAQPVARRPPSRTDHGFGRRALLQGMGGLVVVGAGSRFGASGALAGVDGFALMPAAQAESLADSFGVVIHLNSQKSIYGNEQAIVRKVHELGARHARNRLTPNLPAVRAGFKALAAGGCQINGTCQLFGDRSQPSNQQLMNEVVNGYGGDAGGVFSSFEGVNEPNNNNKPWVAETRSRTIDLWRQAKSRSSTDGIPIVGPALADTWTLQQDYRDLGDLSSYVDRGSIHVYPRGTSPSTLIDKHVGYARASYGQHPFFCTEGGYNNALNQKRLRPVPEQVAGIYGPRHLLEHYLRGNRFFRYELMDDVDSTKSVWESNFGLVKVTSKDPSGWSNKPAYTAMKNMLALVGDRGADFTPRGLPMTITGGGGDVRSVLLQKRNGVHYLCLWRDVSVYDPAKRLYTAVATHDVTVTLQAAARVKLYQPSTQADAVASPGSTTSFRVPLAGVVYIAEIG